MSQVCSQYGQGVAAQIWGQDEVVGLSLTQARALNVRLHLLSQCWVMVYTTHPLATPKHHDHDGVERDYCAALHDDTNYYAEYCTTVGVNRMLEIVSFVLLLRWV